MNDSIKKLLIIWIFALVIRVLFCFIWSDVLFPDEQGFLYYDIIGYDLILKFTGYIPKFIGFSVILTPVFYLLGYFGVRIFLTIVSSLGVFSIYYLMKNITENEDIIIFSTILYNFNVLALYYSSFIVTENLFYPLAPLILALFFKHINSTHTQDTILETEKIQKFPYIYLILIGLSGITLSIRITFGLIYLVGLIFLIVYHEGEKIVEKKSIYHLLKEIGIIIIFGIIALIPVLIFSIANHLNPINVLLQTIFWNIGFFQPISNSIGYFSLYLATIFIPIFIYLPFIIKEVKSSVNNISFKRSIITLLILAWIIFQHTFYYGHQYEIALMRWNVSTFPGYFLLFIWGYERSNQEFAFLDKKKYITFFLVSSISLAVAFKFAFLELFNPSRAWILYVGITVVCITFVTLYFLSRRET
ncbi:MAG: hypothetical protein ACTSRG_06550 [Candidatus Helarchaeota archaeon]